MNDYASLKKQKKSGSVIWAIIAVLIVLELFSLTMLGGQLVMRASTPQRNYISLTEASAITKLDVTKKQAVIIPSIGRISYKGNVNNEVASLSTTPGLEIKDEKTVWSTTTEIEIFKIKYENGELVTTVNSSDGNKVIAPGTENSYWFTLTNNSQNALKYKLYVEAYITCGDDTVESYPVEAKMYDDGNNYILGGADEWKPVLELDGKTAEGDLAKGNMRDYTIKWQWPFERTDGEGLDANDSFDTMLGNLSASGETVELTIVIRTEAEETDDGGGTPKPTGSAINIPVFAAVSIVSFIAIVVLLTGRRKERRA